VISGGMVDNAMAQQRPILHQAEHGIPLSMGRSRSKLSGSCAVIQVPDRRPSPVVPKLATAPEGATVSL
jgi:hypothetical protein